MSEVLEDLSGPALAAAIEGSLFEYFEYLSRSPSVEAHRRPGIVGFVTGIVHPFMNGVCCAQGVPDDAVEEALTYLKSRELPFMCWVESTAPSGDWREALKAQGLACGEGVPGMAADLLALNEDAAPPTGLAIEPVGDRVALRHFLRAGMVGFDIPDNSEEACLGLFAGLGYGLPLRSYVGLLDGKPVAASQLFLGAGVAGIYWVATIPEARGKGIGTAMTLAPMRDARAAGHRIGILHPSPMGRGVYERLGFEECGRVACGAWMGEPQE